MATINEVLADKVVAEEFFSKETPEEAQAFLQGKGVEITLDEIKAIGAALVKQADGELSEDDLEDVAGGGMLVQTAQAIETGLEQTWRRTVSFFKRW